MEGVHFPEMFGGLRDVRGTGPWWASMGGNVAPHHRLCLDKGLRIAEYQGGKESPS